MSYVENSSQAKIGKVGEWIVKNILENMDAKVNRADRHGEKSLIDFHARPIEGSAFKERLVEVKVRSAMQYAYGQYPCYSFPCAQIDAYIKFAREKKLLLELWIVDPTAKSYLIAQLFPKSDWIDFLFLERFIDGKKFPFIQETKFGKYYFFHQKQFYEWSLRDRYINALNTLKLPDSFFPCAQTVDIITAPNGTNIDILSIENSSRFFVKMARLASAVNNKYTSVPIKFRLVAGHLNITTYEFYAQRLSGKSSYGTKALCLDIQDVPKFLRQYCELIYHTDKHSTDFDNAMELAMFFENLPGKE